MEIVKMKIKFGRGEYIWFSSILLYLIWAFIGIYMNIQYLNISLIGSLGMIVFVILSNLIRIKIWQKKYQ